MRRRIAQIGTFDVENFGDLLFPDVLKIKLGDCFDIDLFSANRFLQVIIGLLILLSLYILAKKI